MLRSLWSGVGGMQSHQIALDVEGNNIANVNTAGFKYSRANFADLLPQVNRIATAPQGSLGGMNDMSVGLGTSINSTERIHSQGSLQQSDKNTDVAIGGEGFFIVSPDAGLTNNYSRNGNFIFDANGNLVNSAGFIAQGWTRDITVTDGTNLFAAVDSSGPIAGIQIDPALVMPAQATTALNMIGNLTTATTVTDVSRIYELDSTAQTASDGVATLYDSAGRVMQLAENFGALFDRNGQAFTLQEGQGNWFSYRNAEVIGAVAVNVGVSTVGINGTNITFTNDSAVSRISTMTAARAAINAQTSLTGVQAFESNGQIRLVNTNSLDGGAEKKNILISATGTGGLAGFVVGTADETAFRYQFTTSSDPDSAIGQFATTEDLRRLIQQDANQIKRPDLVYSETLTSAASVKVTVNNDGRFEITNQNDDSADVRNLAITVSSFFDTTISTNVLFKNNFTALNTAILTEGGTATTSSTVNATNKAGTIAIIDSLGGKHNLRTEFRKTGTSEWSLRFELPSPATFVGGSADDPSKFEGGRITFGTNGELSSVFPPVLQVNFNNGSSPDQRIELNFGTDGTFNGMTSTNLVSDVSPQQDGYQAGRLDGGLASGVRFDSSGTLIASFSNGKSVAIAQLGIAVFPNNSGLESLGSNHYAQSANSGDPIVGTASTGTRGSVSGGYLEMSNVDLSRALTQLIIVQRGYQANSKTVTTSDQILNTLINLKQ